MNIKALILVALALAALALSSCSGSEPPTPTASVPNTQTAGEVAITQYSRPPEMSIDAAKSYTATLKTNHGEIIIELFASDAPATVNSFVFLARENFYDGVIFHRVIDGFMIQGGDPTGTGTGGRATSSRTNSSLPSPSRSRVSWPWPTRAPGPTAASSSSPSPRHLTSTATTPSSAR